MAKTKFSEKSALTKSIQPILIAACLLLFAYIGYRTYVTIQDGIKSAQENLKKRGFTVEGSQVNLRVKRKDTSRYLDETQRAFVSAWNNAETKGYYSRLWSKQDLRDKPEKKK